MAHFVHVTDEIGHGGETPQARTWRAQILTVRIFVTQEVEQAEKDHFIIAFYRQKRVPVQYPAVFVPITEVSVMR